MSSPNPFLRDQRLSLLDAGHAPLPLLDLDAARELRDRGGFREEAKDSPWKNLARAAWLAGARGSLCRTVVVADAGLGKTTNLRWLAAELAREQPSQLTFFLSIDQLPDDPEGLFDVLLRECWRAAPGCSDPARLTPAFAHRALRTRRDAGRLTLVLDSLDQALSRPAAVETLRLLLTRGDWRACPIVVSTRPHALTTEWNKVFDGHAADWRFVRVEQLDVRQQRFLLGTVADETDPAGRARVDRFDLIPTEGRSLLGVPRVIDLLRQIGTTRAAYAGLRTMADVYWRATGEMLIEGLKAHRAGATLGRKGRTGPVPLTFRSTQCEIARNMLGAVAFEMFVNAAGPTTVAPRPNLSHVPETTSDGFLTQVYTRLLGAADAHRTAKRVVEAQRLGVTDDEQDFHDNFAAVAAMNAGALENYLLDDCGRHRDIRWRNPTMQAFFAAAWVGRHGTPDDFARLRGWVVEPADERWEEFREFWRFACELGGAADAVRRDTWVNVMAPLYDGTARDPEGRPVRSCEFIHRGWDSMAGTAARATFLAEFPGILDPEKRRTAETLLAGFVDLVRRVLPGDTGHFTMGAPDGEDPSWDGKGEKQTNPLHPVTLTHYRLHRFCVTNAEYELFDPRHATRRGFDTQNTNEARCPAVNVSWYDAWCFAKWLGVVRHGGVDYTLSLPTEAQWEYACRAGAGPKRPFSFGPSHNGETCTADVCNFNGGYPWGEGAKKGEYRKRTLPVDALAEYANKWTFVQMHGNVWEWCWDRFSARFYSTERGKQADPVNTEEASSRVLRGGSWLNDGRGCRSAHRGRNDPSDRLQDYGFRLAAVPEAGAK